MFFSGGKCSSNLKTTAPPEEVGGFLCPEIAAPTRLHAFTTIENYRIGRLPGDFRPLVRVSSDHTQSDIWHNLA